MLLKFASKVDEGCARYGPLGTQLSKSMLCVSGAQMEHFCVGLGLYSTIVVFFALSVIKENRSEMGRCTFRDSSFLFFFFVLFFFVFFFILFHVLLEISSWGKESAPVGAGSSLLEWTLF